MTNKILIITIGNTDIKAVIKETKKAGEDQDKAQTEAITTLATIGDHSRPEFCGYLAEHCIDVGSSSQKLAFTLLEPNEALDVLTAQDFEQQEKPLYLDFTINDGKAKFTAPKFCTLRTPDCPELLLPKIAPLVNELQHIDFTPNYVLVLNTNRQASNKLSTFIKKKEPFAYGPYIANRLSKSLKLPYNQEFDHTYCTSADIKQGVYYLNFLTGDDLLEGADQNDPINRQALEKISTAIQALCSRVEPSQNQLILSCGGGFPKLKAQLEAICELYADKVLAYSEPEMRSSSAPAVTLANTHHYPSPDVSLRARKQCIALIQHGNFQGAAALAQPFVDDENKNRCDKGWAHNLITASEWLQGRVSIDKLNATLPAALPFNTEAELPNCLWAAFRIEAALKMGNYQEAIRFTCDFVEVAAQDLLCHSFTPNQFEINAAKAQCEVIKKQYEEQITTLFQRKTKKPLDSLLTCCFDLKIDRFLKYKAEQGSDRNLLFDFAIALSKLKQNEQIRWEDLNNHPLLQFEHTLRTKPEKCESTPQRYRNRITHGYLSPTDVKEAKNTFIHAKLWDEDREYAFLTQPLFLDIFDLLVTNKQRASDLYSNLVKTLCQQMLNAPINFTED
ncbi:hypothetical protein L3V43_04280 [Pseudoalteromonas sp. L23]|uniref:hypothetical protein n=1 Tax=unclassified Pseudoalteromonas TaxID=194690 RepID=UPI001EF15A7F|nr:MULTISPECIES: hypothetical protein [unclassified Pseudoalteromonas]MCF7512819.1 hypothetical protein [Pseudoalteromonas sp. L7]MCF7524860.1 hypothetical protein [Pseudoalteromonas sp. L23]MCX2765313.1 hypothetical protein [Pseudoalteromonas sp. B530]